MPLSSFVVAIPSYNRVNELIRKTLSTLKDGGIAKKHIYIFVANKEQYDLYEASVPKTMYHKIIIGKKGIANQRIFISDYFPENQYIISMDDDVEKVLEKKGEKLVPIKHLQPFFKDAYDILKKTGLYIWGIYPVTNPFFMKQNISFGLKFIIGVMHGYINRHNSKLRPSKSAETKEDIEQSILYYLHDGGVVRFNSITTKTKFNAPGGLGTDRHERNKLAAEYLKRKYPDIITVFTRKSGTYEVRLARLHYEKK